MNTPDVTKPARVPYFLRPKHPRDWRWYVGGLGRVFIVTGLLMFAFVGYQLWGTGLQTAQEQNRLEDEFEKALNSTTAYTTTTTIPASTTTGSPLDSVPVPSDVPPESTIPVAPQVPLEPGDAIAKIIIPSIDLSAYVVEGVDTSNLRKGPGHFPETPMPGQLGNAAIAGHRTTYGHPFLRLDRLVPGDIITVQTLLGSYTYSVTGSEIVPPSGYGQVIPTKDPSKATLTLATCTPAYTARDRLIVYADLVAEQSDQVMAPPPPVTTTTAPPTTTAPLTTDTVVTDTTDVAATSTTDGTTDDTTTTVFVDGLGDEGAQDGVTSTNEDAFSEGWFSDSAAIPHVLLWGALLALVSIGAYFVGKRMLKLHMCFVVGAVPFIVVLYFFFENVNRLLPPGL